MVPLFFFLLSLQRIWFRSSMDRMKDSGSFDWGSSPHGITEQKRVSKKYLAPSIYSYPYWRLKSNIRFYKGVFCLFGHPLCFLL